MVKNDRRRIFFRGLLSSHVTNQFNPDGQKLLCFQFPTAQRLILIETHPKTTRDSRNRSNQLYIGVVAVYPNLPRDSAIKGAPPTNPSFLDHTLHQCHHSSDCLPGNHVAHISNKSRHQQFGSRSELMTTLQRNS